MKIPIKKYQMDPKLSWEERYKQLEAHHVEETQWLITYIKQLESILRESSAGSSQSSRWESLNTVQKCTCDFKGMKLTKDKDKITCPDCIDLQVRYDEIMQLRGTIPTEELAKKIEELFA